MYAEIEVPPTQCWGWELGSRSCAHDFVLGHNHFKNKFCANCRKNGITVPASQLQAIDGETRKRFENSNAGGFWSAQGTRLVNQTGACTGPRLVLFRDAPPEGTEWALSGHLDVGEWAQMPPQWLGNGGTTVTLIISKGTLVPRSNAPLGTRQREDPCHEEDTKRFRRHSSPESGTQSPAAVEAAAYKVGPVPFVPLAPLPESVGAAPPPVPLKFAFAPAGAAPRGARGQSLSRTIDVAFAADAQILAAHKALREMVQARLQQSELPTVGPAQDAMAALLAPLHQSEVALMAASSVPHGGASAEAPSAAGSATAEVDLFAAMHSGSGSGLVARSWLGSSVGSISLPSAGGSLRAPGLSPPPSLPASAPGSERAVMSSTERSTLRSTTSLHVHPEDARHAPDAPRPSKWWQRVRTQLQHQLGGRALALSSGATPKPGKPRRAGGSSRAAPSRVAKPSEVSIVCPTRSRRLSDVPGMALAGETKERPELDSERTDVDASSEDTKDEEEAEQGAEPRAPGGHGQRGHTELVRRFGLMWSTSRAA